MRFTLATVVAMASSVSAHAVMYGAWVNGKDQGDGKNTYVRSPPNNNPVKDLTSSDLVCNVNGAKAGTDFVKAAAGDKITFEWYHNTRDDDIIASSHLGPIITYIADYTSGDGTGAIWTKIAEEGYDGSKWAVENLISNKGKIDFTLPSSLKAGKYLIRQEIIALHEADATYNENSARGAQFYPSCVQFQVTGSGSASPSQDFDFNKGYKYTDPGIHFNLYGTFSSYSIPGPAVWGGSGGSSSNSTSPAAATTPAAAAPADTGAATTAPAASQTLATVVVPSTASSSGSGSGSDTGSGSGSGSGSVNTTVAAAPATKTKTSCSARRRRRRNAAKRAL